MTSYRIDGLHCGACVAKVTAALQPHAATVQVSLNPPRAVLTGVRADLPGLQAAVAAAGAYHLDSAPADSGAAPWWRTYYPLLLIVGLLALVSCAGMGNGFDPARWMQHFMAGFFITFAFFKLLDLRGFADAYAGYDLLAARCRSYAVAYPFIELGLGLAYLFGIAPLLTLWLTLLLMLFGSIGVVRALWRGQQIRCACLGTVLNLPMSKVTLIENWGMAAMAAAMLVNHP